MNITDHLSKLTKVELIKLLVGLSNEIEEVEQALSLKFTDPGHKEGLTPFIKIIRSSIKENSDRHGFVNYRNVPYAVEGAEKVLEKAEEVGGNGYHLRAVEIGFCVMHEMGELLQSCDDSGGIVGGLIRECLDFVRRIAGQLEESKIVEKLSLAYRNRPALLDE